MLTEHLKLPDNLGDELITRMTKDGRLEFRAWPSEQVLGYTAAGDEGRRAFAEMLTRIQVARALC
jgi:hypothetical protein